MDHKTKPKSQISETDCWGKRFLRVGEVSESWGKVTWKHCVHTWTSQRTDVLKAKREKTKKEETEMKILVLFFVKADAMMFSLIKQLIFSLETISFIMTHLVVTLPGHRSTVLCWMSVIVCVRLCGVAEYSTQYTHGKSLTKQPWVILFLVREMTMLWKVFKKENLDVKTEKEQKE